MYNSNIQFYYLISCNMAVQHFSDSTFQADVLASNDLVMVDFFAEWCGPCRQLGPIIEELAKEFEGRPVKVGKVDIDKETATAEKYGVMSIPTLLFFKNGEIVEQFRGAQSITILRQRVEALMTR